MTRTFSSKKQLKDVKSVNFKDRPSIYTANHGCMRDIMYNSKPNK